MNIFERWFEGELRRRGYDAEVWTNYLISLLDSHEDILPILTEMNMNLDSGELEIFYHQIMEYYDHPDQIPQILIEDLDNNVQSHEYQVNNNDVEDALDTRELDIDSHLISDTLDMLDEDYNNEIGENENEFETLEIIDYVSLAQELEYLISSSEPTVLFSTDSIMESLYYSYGVVEDSFNLLHYNYYMCGIAPPARPCRHLIQSGKCLRSDCMFDHSFSSKTCKFWLTTGCLSPECLFLHHLIFPESQLTGNSDATTLDSQDFPELISSKAPGSLHTVQPSISYKSALSKAPRNEERISSQNFNQNRSSKSVGSISSHSINQNFWVESGESVCSNYKETREEARTLAIARNKLLEEATQAYLRGAKDIAKRLAKEGQEINKKMKESHQKAAMSIFRRRNTPKSVFTDFRLDLHGLHVQEARECVLSVLSQIAQSVPSRSSYPKVTVITGTGHHTHGPQIGVARVLKAIESLCDEYQLSYAHIKDPRGYVGGVLIQLRENIDWNY